MADARQAGHGPGYLEGVGEDVDIDRDGDRPAFHGEAAVRAERLGQRDHRRPAVEEYGVPVLDLGQARPGDGPFAADVGVGPGRDVGLVGGPHCQSSSVGTPEEPLGIEVGDVLADGGLGHADQLGQLAHAYPATGVDELEDPTPAFVSEHPRLALTRWRAVHRGVERHPQASAGSMSIGGRPAMNPPAAALRSARLRSGDKSRGVIRASRAQGRSPASS